MLRLDISAYFIEQNRLSTVEQINDYGFCIGKNLYFNHTGNSLGQKQSLTKYVLLKTFDFAWQEHIVKLSNVKEGIHSRAYGHMHSLQEYQKESWNPFEEMVSKWYITFVHFFLSDIKDGMQIEQDAIDEESTKGMKNETKSSMARNALYHYNSGKKVYKESHGKLEE